MIAEAICAACNLQFRYERGKGPPRRYHPACAERRRLAQAAAIKRRNRKEGPRVNLCIYCKKPIPAVSRKGGRPPKQHFECGLRAKQARDRERYASRRAERRGGL